MTEHKALKTMQSVHPMLLKAFSTIHLPPPNMAACLQHVTTKESLECIFINLDLGEIVLSISVLQLRQVIVYMCVRQGLRMECDTSGQWEVSRGVRNWSQHRVGQLVISCGSTNPAAIWRLSQFLKRR
jgi:hypothetical protein